VPFHLHPNQIRLMNTPSNPPTTPEKKPGLRLITFLTILAIIGILASIFIPTVGRVRESARGSGSYIWSEPGAERVHYLDPLDQAIRPRSEPWNTDAFDPIVEAGFSVPLIEPLSTFSIDVDTASYAKVREFLREGRLPPPDAVRIEELINYFPYADAAPDRSPANGGDPFALRTELTSAPWAPQHHLLRINLKGYEIPWDDRPPSNLVFLIDVSGSMNPENRLPLVKKSLRLLVERLDARDRIAIVVYAGNSGLALPSTPASETRSILRSIDRLEAGGSTNAGQGIQLAYATARDHFIEGGNNRVILCTDGDFNVGVTDRGQLGELVQQNADEGVSLTVLGFGMGNYKDNMLEDLSNKGKGTYGYIDTEAEARKFFVHQIASNLFNIAHDVKIQVEFNPAEVAAYRLIGYENRKLRPEEFNDDSARAGDIGPGHTVTAFYEIVPAHIAMDLPGVDPLRYQTVAITPGGAGPGELATLKVRFKRPEEDRSELLARTISTGQMESFAETSDDLRFGAAVASFGMRLRNSPHVANYTWKEIRDTATASLGADPEGYRAEFLRLVAQASSLSSD
jgi:Ca-activated chloride channel homolog